MDVNETVKAYHAAMAARQWEDAIDSAESILHWLKNGGFIPASFVTSDKKWALAHTYSMLNEAKERQREDKETNAADIASSKKYGF